MKTVKILFAAALAALALVPLFAQDARPDPTSQEIIVPTTIVNNEYYQRSVRLTQQAKDAYEEGDYDAARIYAEQAADFARQSDEYVARRLADYAIAKAGSRYQWATSVGAATRYPDEYVAAGIWLSEAQEARRLEEWENAVRDSQNVLIALANVTDSKGKGQVTSKEGAKEPPGPRDGTLPAQYTVRYWRSTGDCFSNIAGWSWVYGNVYQWRKLYEANKSKLPNPDNPHLLLPGTVLDIPSLSGEKRSGMYDPARKY
jgi:hypothetical protein